MKEIKSICQINLVKCGLDQKKYGE